MASDELLQSWARTESYLRNARSQLPSSLDGADSEAFKFYIDDFEDYLSHNELELALIMLEEAAQFTLTDADFWQNMFQAAKNMELTEKAFRFRRFLEEN